MKVSLIPPFRLLDWVELGADNYHLVLAAEVLTSNEYANYYAKLAKRGHYVFLDNSAHELGTGMNVHKLLLAADAVGAAEMILPDRLFFADDTLELSEIAIRQIRKQKPQVRLMGVPQGRTITEWTVALKGLLGMGVSCIGISKDYEVWPRGLCGLIDLVRRESRLVDIHLLGWGRDAGQLYEISRDPTLNIRGVDSTKPFVYAMSGIAMHPPGRMEEDETSQPAYPRRKSNYFEAETDQIPDEMIRHNINVFRLYANARPI